jgi:hypothetical protein
MTENLTLDFGGTRPKYPMTHRSPVDGRSICCKVCRLFFNEYGVPQRVWNRMSQCAKLDYQPKTETVAAMPNVES